MIKSLYTAFIHKYPDQKSINGLSEKSINEIMWAYDKQAEYLIKQEKFEESFVNYEQALGILPTHLGCLNNYAITLYKLARIKQDQTLFEKALKLYEKALRIESDDADTLGNYGNALSDLALIKQDQILSEKAFEQYEKALAIEPNHARRLGNYAIALTGLAQIKQDHMLFDKAFEYYKKALHLEPNNTYNLACYYAVLGNADLCQKYLLHAENHNTLPLRHYQHLTEDRDLDAVRHEEWFIELLDRLKEKEAITEKSS